MILIHSVYVDQKHGHYVGVILDAATELGSSNVMISVILIDRAGPLPLKVIKDTLAIFLLPSKGNSEPQQVKLQFP